MFGRTDGQRDGQMKAIPIILLRLAAGIKAQIQAYSLKMLVLCISS